MTQEELAVAPGITETPVPEWKGMGPAHYLLDILEFYDKKGVKSHVIKCSKKMWV